MVSLKKILLFLSGFSFLSGVQKTFVLPPVVDILMHSGNYYRWLYKRAMTVEDIYNNLSLSPSKDHTTCHRYRQLLNGDSVEIIGEEGIEAHIKTDLVRYVKENARNENDAWTLKRHLASPSLTSLYQELLDSPETSHWVLVKPWHNTQHGITLSPGTRLAVKTANSTTKILSAFLLFENPERIELTTIPTDYALPLINRSEDEMRSIFVSALQTLATENEKGIVPLVWGGMSTHKRIKPDDRKVALKQIDKILIAATAWFDEAKTERPLSGVDATGLILLASRIAKLSMNYNNSATIAHYGQEIFSVKDLKPGDLIYIPGFVAAVSSVEENKVVLARGYNAEIGRVYEAELKDLSSNAPTFEAFFKLKEAKKTVMINENLYDEYKAISLMSLQQPTV